MAEIKDAELNAQTAPSAETPTEVPIAPETTSSETSNEEVSAPDVEEAATAAPEEVIVPEEAPVEEPVAEVTEPEPEAEPEEAPAEPEPEVTEEAPAEPEPEAEPEEAPAEPEVTEEAPAEPEAEAAPEEEATTEEAPAFPHYKSLAEVIERAKAIVEGGEEITAKEENFLKTQFYRLQEIATRADFQKFTESGGDPDSYQPLTFPEEAEFKAALALVHNKRQQQQAEIDKLKEENYAKKLDIIAKIKDIVANTDDINRSYNYFKQLQQQWQEIKAVPQDKATDLWKSYQLCVESFYDTLKLNNEFRAYDFKKNLELKTALCERAEKLAEMADVIAASRALQDLHQQFREIGPVDKDKREEVWNRFKAASTIVNRRHQEYFDQRKKQEEQNLAEKTAICEELEKIDTDNLKTFAEWNAVTDTITALQAKWKTIGFAPQKMNEKIYERYRAACDKFFSLKTEYFKKVKETLSANLDLKKALCEQAEALKDSTDWKATTEAIKELQKKWREIGTVPKKYSDAIWKRFNAACDAFFDARKAANSGQINEMKANLEKKRSIIERLKAIIPEETQEDVRDLVHSLQDEWAEIGHVPFRDKDKIYAAYREQLDRLYKYANTEASRRRISRFKNEIKGDGNKLRDRLVREYEILKNEIKTYENNLGFLNLSSKSGNTLIEELNRKVEKLKNDLQEIVQKIKVIDENAKAEENKEEE